MNLPDFTNEVSLNRLRELMGAELKEFTMNTWNSFDEDNFLIKLNSQEGIDVDISKIVFDNENGTFEYNGQKVLLYIRDQKFNPNYGGGEYKFHICNCKTIDSFIQNNRIDRYVVSTNTNGRFLVNIVNSLSNQYYKKNVIKELKVCKNCLEQLNYKGYSQSHQRRAEIYRNFDLKEFFSLYETKHRVIPKNTDISARPDLYSKNQKEINDNIKKLKNWKCDKCNVDLSMSKHYLHVHHINGVKSDNSMTNLKVLCIKCHSDEPDHNHLKFTEAYTQFYNKYSELKYEEAIF